MSISSSRAPWPEGRSTGVHHIQARKAFEPGSGAYPAQIVEHNDATVVVERLLDRTAVTLAVARPIDFAATLDRDDLARLDSSPLALVHEGLGVLGVATGPAAAPPRIALLSTISRLEDGYAVEIPAADDTQPSWQLFGVVRQP